MKKITFVALLLITSNFAYADTYASIGYLNGTYDELGVPSASPTGLRFKYGALSETVGWEAHFATGINSDTVTVLGIPVELELDWIYSIFLRGNISANKANIYGLIGFSSGELTASAVGISVSTAESSISYGIGADYQITDNTYFNIDYTMYLDTTAFDLSAIGFDIRYSF